MTFFEETRRIDCQNSAGRRVTIIEQRKWAAHKADAQKSDAREAIYDYMTEDGQIANKLDDENFLLLLTDEVFHRA